VVKVWLDGHQYRVIDTTLTPTVGEMRRAMAVKLSVPVDSFDMLLEIGLSNGGMRERVREAWESGEWKCGRRGNGRVE
jgi:hypothetical protein